MQLIEEMRTAIAKDQEGLGLSDAQLADLMREMLPRISQKSIELTEQLRLQVAANAPWALVALDSELDLLSPLGKQRHEPSHTQILAYLLDPKQRHGLGVSILRAFFSILWRTTTTDDVFERLSRQSAEGTDTLRRVSVKAERPFDLADRSARCDIWLELDDKERLLVVVIENKIDAGEHGAQLAAYEGAFFQRAHQRARERRRTSFDTRLVLLSPDGRPPARGTDQTVWAPVSYTSLAAALALLPESFPLVEFREKAVSWPKKSRKSQRRLDWKSSSVESAHT